MNTQQVIANPLLCLVGVAIAGKERAGDGRILGPTHRLQLGDEVFQLLL